MKDGVPPYPIGYPPHYIRDVIDYGLTRVHPHKRDDYLERVEAAIDKILKSRQTAETK